MAKFIEVEAAFSDGKMAFIGVDNICSIRNKVAGGHRYCEIRFIGDGNVFDSGYTAASIIGLIDAVNNEQGE